MSRFARWRPTRGLDRRRSMGTAVEADMRRARFSQPWACHPGRRAKRADPAPRYPGIGHERDAGIPGSRLPRQEALGRDDTAKVSRSWRDALMLATCAI